MYTLGLVPMIVVHKADIQDREAAKSALDKAKSLFPRRRPVCGDGGYAGRLIDWVMTTCNWVPEIVRRDPDAKGLLV